MGVRACVIVTRAHYRRGWVPLREANLSAQTAAATASPRLPRSHGQPGWKKSAQAPTGKGASPPRRLTWRTVDRSRPGGRTAGRSLRTGEDFQTVYREGIRHVSALATVYVLPRQNGQVRLGVPAGRRLGHAVTRNRLRRRVREAVARLRPMMSHGADVVVVPRAPAAQSPFSELVDALAEAFSAAGVLGADGTPPSGSRVDARRHTG